ncbi:MAG: hypothetical protein GWP39_07305 [Planctomycetia bacterium]|nr:hypothetical protein [Planctomycetia bacterium]
MQTTLTQHKPEATNPLQGEASPLKAEASMAGLKSLNPKSLTAQQVQLEIFPVSMKSESVTVDLSTVDSTVSVTSPKSKVSRQHESSVSTSRSAARSTTSRRFWKGARGAWDRVQTARTSGVARVIPESGAVSMQGENLDLSQDYDVSECTAMDWVFWGLGALSMMTIFILGL